MIRKLGWALLATIELASILGFIAVLLTWILLTQGSLPI